MFVVPKEFDGNYHRDEAYDHMLVQKSGWLQNKTFLRSPPPPPLLHRARSSAPSRSEPDRFGRHRRSATSRLPGRAGH